MDRHSRISPFIKQCFVTAGVALNTMDQALINGFSSIMVPQLRKEKYFPLDDVSESWIASIHNISLMFGVLIVPYIMGTFGRKVANLLSAVVLCISWFSLSLSSELYSILLIKLIQGFCSGMISIFGSLTIGEYTSPKYRGAFLSTIALSYSIGILLVHGLGTVLSWQYTACVFGALKLLNCVIIVYSPESPSFLLSRGKYDECRKVFQWLRYSEEEIELERLMNVHMNKPRVLHQRKKSSGCTGTLKWKINCWMLVLKKKEFYKPIILMFHLHLINEWSGATVIDAYTTDIYNRIVDSNVNMSLLIISTDILRFLTNCIAVIVIKRLRRRIMLITTVSLNVIVYYLIAAYVFVKNSYEFSYDNSIIGVVLIHLHIFSIASGSLPLPNIISGEIFALEYRGLSNMIALVFFIVNVIINSKTLLLMFSLIGLHGTYCIYGGFVSYGLLISWLMLPETKDRTLQDIEEEFRGRPLLTEKVMKPTCPSYPEVVLSTIKYFVNIR